MKRKILVLALAFATVLACKSDKKETEKAIEKETTKEEVVKKENITITLNAVVPQNDTFTIQYTEDKAFTFKPKDVVEVKVTGANTPQDLVFELPNKILPTKFMLKTGTNNYKDVVINNVTISNDNRKFQVNQNNFIQFFNPNKFIDYNRTYKTFTSKKIGNNFVPAFVSRPLLIQRLEEKVY